MKSPALCPFKKSAIAGLEVIDLAPNLIVCIQEAALYTITTDVTLPIRNAESKNRADNIPVSLLSRRYILEVACHPKGKGGILSVLEELLYFHASRTVGRSQSLLRLEDGHHDEWQLILPIGFGGFS